MSERADLTLDMGSTPIGKLIWKMSIPSIVSVMAYNVYNLTDTLFVSRGAGMDALGGVAVSFPLYLLLSAVSSTLGGGAASVLSRALGENDRERAAKAAGNTMSLFYLTAFLVTVFGLVFLEPLLCAMGVTGTLLPYAKRYTGIILLGAVTSTGFSSLIRAEGDSRYAMRIWVIPLSANVALDALFIFGLGLGEIGAALGTVMAQCISMGMSVYYFFLSGKSILCLKPRHFIPDWHILREVILIGIPSFLQMSGYSITIIIVNLYLKTFSDDLGLSTYGIVSKINTLLLFPITGLAQGIQPIIGYNQGAGKKRRALQTLGKASSIAAGYGVIAYGIVLCFAPVMLRLFTQEAEVVLRGSTMLKTIHAGLIFSSLQYVQTIYFQAIGKSKTAVLLSLCNQVICFAPTIFFMTGLYQEEGIWISFPISAAAALIVSSAFTVHTVRQAKCSLTGDDAQR